MNHPIRPFGRNRNEDHMSKCISIHGEYSEHKLGTPDDEFTCSRCCVLDEDAIRHALTVARASRDGLAQRLADLTRSINDQLAPEIIRQKGEAWDACADLVSTDHSTMAGRQLRAENPYRTREASHE